MFVIGTTSACALKLFRNTIALEKDEEQVCFIKPIPPLAAEPGELIELDDELLEDPTVVSLIGEDTDTQL